MDPKPTPTGTSLAPGLGLFKLCRACAARFRVEPSDKWPDYCASCGRSSRPPAGRSPGRGTQERSDGSAARPAGHLDGPGNAGAPARERNAPLIIGLCSAGWRFVQVVAP